MTTSPNNLHFDKEIKQCSIIAPYEALQSDFAKKLIDYLASRSKFKEQHIRDIAHKLDDQTQTLTPEEGKDFLEFIDENKEFFDKLIKRYKGQFPAWIQSAVDSDSLNMEQKDHVLYMDGKYLSLDKIKNYVRSCIKGQLANGSHEGLIESLSDYQINYFRRWVKPDFELCKKFNAINYSRRVNKHGILIHNLNGIIFT